jgi:hypothetical protein
MNNALVFSKRCISENFHDYQCTLLLHHLHPHTANGTSQTDWLSRCQIEAISLQRVGSEARWLSVISSLRVRRWPHFSVSKTQTPRSPPMMAQHIEGREKFAPLLIFSFRSTSTLRCNLCNSRHFAVLASTSSSPCTASCRELC